MLNGQFKFYLSINISIILGYTFIYFKIFVRHCHKQKVDLYYIVLLSEMNNARQTMLWCGFLVFHK